MKNIFSLAALIAMGCMMQGCSKLSTDHEAFLDNHEIIYPGMVTNLSSMPGNLRTALTWNPSPDPSITMYRIFWNNNHDSIEVKATTHVPKDTVKAVINGLNEYVYAFTMYSYDAKGNKSIPQDINNVRVYGPIYQGGLFNRSYNAGQPYEVSESGVVKLNFNKPDTINIATAIKYTNASGTTKEVLLDPNSTSISLNDYKFGTPLLYRSTYIPVKGSIDTFPVSKYDTFPSIIRIVMCDKSLFKPLYLPNDAGTAYGWVLPNLWDNNTGEPGFHTPDVTFPISITADMGTAATLTNFKIWQRLSGLYNYGNPKKLEVWGSNNPNPDGSWESWTKLGSFTTAKPSGQPNGQNSTADQAMAAAGDPYVFPAPTQAVRYIRFKILEVWDPGSHYFHILEISMYKNN